MRCLKVAAFFIVLSTVVACADAPKPVPAAEPETVLSPADKLTAELDSIGKNVKLAVSAAIVENGDSFSYKGDALMPMQSTFKLPLAIAIADLCKQKNISLDTTVAVLPSDLVEDTWSPMRDSFGTKAFSVRIKDLLYFVTACSDNIACDVLFRLYGGPQKVDEFIAQKGFPEIEIKNTEVELHEQWQRQYQNVTSASSMTRFLTAFYKNQLLDTANTTFIMDLMLHNKTGDARIRAGVPNGTIVADKTGTSYPEGGPLTVNDIGIITLPDGRHLALSVYITDAHMESKNGEELIAAATNAVYRYFTGNATQDPRQK